MKYYLNDNGYMLTNSFVQDGSDLYYVDASGAMAVNRWIYGKDNRLDQTNHWYYFGSNGKALRNLGQEAKKTINGKIYAFDEHGRMLTGLLDEGGHVLDGNSDQFLVVSIRGADKQ